MQYTEKIDTPLLKKINKENIITSIQLKPDGFIFSIKTDIENQVLGFGNYKFDTLIEHEEYQLQALSDIFQSNSLLQTFNVSCRYNNFGKKVTLIPKIYFNPEQLREYLTPVFELDYLDELHYKHVKNTDAYLVYTAPNQVVNYINEKFNKTEVVHPYINIVDKLLLLSKAYKKQVAFVSIEKQYIEFVIVDGEKIILYNNYNHTTADEIVFYLLNVFKKSGLTDMLLFVAGNSVYEGAEFMLLKKYLRKIYQFDPMDYINFSPVFEKFPIHYYSTLFLQ